MNDQAKMNAELHKKISFLNQRIRELERPDSKSGRADEDNHRLSLDGLPLGIRIVTAEGETIYANQAILDIYRYDSIEELKATPVEKRYTPESYAEYQVRKARRKRGENGASEYEISIVRKDGEIRRLQVLRKETLWGGEKQFQVIYQDITDRKRAEAALRESEERYRNIIENIEDGFFELDLSGTLTFFNEPLRRIFDYPRWELLGMNNRQYSTPEAAKRIFEVFNEMYRTNIPGKVTDYEIFRKDGSIRHLEISASLIRDHSGAISGFRGIARDVTERRKREEDQEKLKKQLQQAQKMEAVGTLAGGLAHDFNNLLMTIQGQASMMRLGMEPSHPHYERLKQIEDQVDSGANITRRILGFARGGRYEVRPTQMNDIVERTAAMFGRTKKELTIHTRLARDLSTVEVDHGQMEQVLMNLYVNAWQAMPEGGELYLETKDVVMEESEVKPYKARQGRYVKISVTDTGTGMDERTRARIFDPFFTTKGRGKGTGLGLAMVYGIVKGHGGMINVYSEPGQGTTFTIYLPVSEKQVVEEKPAATQLLTGTETILLVDDEKSVLEISRDMMESLGYYVYAAGSGQEAVDVYKEKREEIDMVILDMIMPGMSGDEVFDRLREINPEIRVLLSSGYSINSHAQKILDQGCKGFLQKPFHLQDLSQKVREVFDS